LIAEGRLEGAAIDLDDPPGPPYNPPSPFSPPEGEKGAPPAGSRAQALTLAASVVLGFPQARTR